MGSQVTYRDGTIDGQVFDSYRVDALPGGYLRIVFMFCATELRSFTMLPRAARKFLASCK